jgi:hypothetical protein
MKSRSRHRRGPASPRRFEAGTPPIAQAVGLAAALDWMGGLDWPGLREREERLCAELIAGLQGGPRLAPARPAGRRRGARRLSPSTSPGLHPHDICQVLDHHGLALRGGHHCAQPLLAAFGVDACTRASLALYNDEADVAALIEGVAVAAKDAGMSDGLDLYQDAIKQMAAPPRTATGNWIRPDGEAKLNNPLVRRSGVHAGGACRTGASPASPTRPGAACCAGRRPRCWAPVPPAWNAAELDATTKALEAMLKEPAASAAATWPELAMFLSGPCLPQPPQVRAAAVSCLAGGAARGRMRRNERSTSICGRTGHVG